MRRKVVAPQHNRIPKKTNGRKIKTAYQHIRPNERRNKRKQRAFYKRKVFKKQSLRFANFSGEIVNKLRRN